MKDTSKLTHTLYTQPTHALAYTREHTQTGTHRHPHTSTVVTISGTLTQTHNKL